MNQVMLKQAGRATFVYVVSGALVSFELAVLISLFWFHRQGWVLTHDAPTTLQIMEEMPGALSLIVLLAVPLVIVHSLVILRFFKRGNQETTP
jgi:hypothetical protein